MEDKSEKRIQILITTLWHNLNLRNIFFSNNASSKFNLPF